MDRWHARLDQLAGIRAKAQAELTKFEPKDPLQAHGVAEPTLAKLATVIAEQRKVKRAWLVRKHGKHLPKVPGYLLLLEFAWTSHLTGGRDDAVRAVLDRFAVDEDGFVAIRDAAESRRLRKAVDAVPGALVFERL
jgi:anti-sigma factor ChrR (cupin superfamily)